MKVAIVGGGISGVAAAHLLAARGVDVDVFEREHEAGGLCRSDVIDGYAFDRAGGHIMFTKSAWCREFWNSLFAPGELVASERNTKILYRGKFVHYPFENGLGDLEPEETLACLRDYVLAWAKRKDGGVVPSNFKDWVRFRMGDAIADGFMDPYNEKIWKCDLRELGIDWVEGRVPDAPLEDVMRAALGQRVEGYKHQIHFHYPRRGGFQTLFERILDPVRDRLHRGHAVERIERRGEQLFVDGEAYDRVISTIPLPILADVLAGMDDDARGAAKALQHRSLTSVIFGIDEGSVQPYSWLYLPHAEQGPANRITYLSNYSPENAPTGRGSLQAEITHAGKLAVDRDYLERLADTFAAQGLLRRDAVDLMHSYPNEWAYILFDRDFTKKRQLAIDGAEKLGVVPLGRFGRFDYFNSDQCLVAAKDCVDRMLGQAPGE
jgi:protoporphyrinogen oxidase